jgi:hypothetical protein
MRLLVCLAFAGLALPAGAAFADSGSVTPSASATASPTPVMQSIAVRFFRDGRPVTLEFIEVTGVTADGLSCSLVPPGTGLVPIITSDHFLFGWPNLNSDEDCLSDTSPTNFEIAFRFPQISNNLPPNDWAARVTWTGGDQTFDLEVPAAYLAYTAPVVTATPVALPQTGGPGGSAGGLGWLLALAGAGALLALAGGAAFVIARDSGRVIA